MDLASLIDATKVGSTFTISPQSLGVPISEFQSAVREIRRLQKDGVVRVAKEHKESSSGNDYVDLLFVEKL